MTTVRAKSITQKSGFKVIFAASIGILIGYVPQVIGVFDFQRPWDGLVPIFMAFLIAILKLVQEYLSNPSVAANNVPARVVNKTGEQVSGP